MGDAGNSYSSAEMSDGKADATEIREKENANNQTLWLRFTPLLSDDEQTLLCAVVSTSIAEIVRWFLVDYGLLHKAYQVRHLKEYVLFPLDKISFKYSALIWFREISQEAAAKGLSTSQTADKTSEAPLPPSAVVLSKILDMMNDATLQENEINEIPFEIKLTSEQKSVTRNIVGDINQSSSFNSTNNILMKLSNLIEKKIYEWYKQKPQYIQCENSKCGNGKDKPHEDIDKELSKGGFLRIGTSRFKPHVSRHSLCRTYRECLEGSPAAMEKLPASHDRIGDLIVLKIPEELLRVADEIGKAVLFVETGARAVFHDGGVKEETRIRNLIRIAGEGSTLTKHKENGLVLDIDIAKAYFSPRLGHERQRIAELVRQGEAVWDIFAGVGP
ncbi:MAG: hypothetical protein QW728_04485, partial [Thermoplasmata archaeon]